MHKKVYLIFARIWGLKILWWITKSNVGSKNSRLGSKQTKMSICLCHLQTLINIYKNSESLIEENNWSRIRRSDLLKISSFSLNCNPNQRVIRELRMHRNTQFTWNGKIIFKHSKIKHLIPWNPVFKQLAYFGAGWSQRELLLPLQLQVWLVP